MKFINLTPHDITVVLVDSDTQSNRSRIFHKSDTIARVSQVSTMVEFIDEVAIRAVKFGPVTGLPQPTDGIKYIVSAMVKSASAGRTDLVSPGDLIRDASGNVIGCKGFFC